MAITSWPALESEYTQLLETMEVKPNWTGRIDLAARKIVANRRKYQEVSNQTGVPWEMIGVIHNLECGLRFDCHLHNGDPLTRRTRQVPKGRPRTGTAPFTWLESAVDALTLKGLQKVLEWPDERIAYELERYNGWGYRSRRGCSLSPYLWSGTNHYTRGKYVRDHVYSPSVVSQQIGAVPLLMQVRTLAGMSRGEQASTVIRSSRTLSRLKMLRNAAPAGGIAAWFTSTLDMFQEWMNQLQGFVSEHKVLVAAGGIALFFGILKLIEMSAVKSHNKGEWSIHEDDNVESTEDVS